MKNTVFPHKFWRPFLDCMPQLFFRPQYVWFPVHLKGHLIPLCYETLVVNWQNWLFTLFHQSRSVLSPNPIHRSPVINPHKGQWCGALMFSLICAWKKRLSKQSWCWWFETPSCLLRSHCNDIHLGSYNVVKYDMILHTQLQWLR